MQTVGGEDVHYAPDLSTVLSKVLGEGGNSYIYWVDRMARHTHEALTMQGAPARRRKISFTFPTRILR